MTENPTDMLPDARRGSRVWTMFVDCVTASIVREFTVRGIDSILLKGPAFARLFYGGEEERFYTDTDLLVQERDVPAATAVLEELGFIRIDRDEDWMGPDPKYSHTLQRLADGALIDLHWRLSGALASPEQLWSSLRDHTINLEVVGQAVAALDAPGSALLVALHNAHHGTGRATTLADVDRAAERLRFDDWLDATCLADELDASNPFAAGLRLTEAGDSLADRLGLARPASVEMWLKVNTSSYGAWVLDRFAQTKSLRGRLQIGWQVIVPPRVVMYRFFPLARRGQLGLGLAYVLRPFRLAAHAAPAIREWARARRTVRSA